MDLDDCLWRKGGSAAPLPWLQMLSSPPAELKLPLLRDKLLLLLPTM